MLFFLNYSGKFLDFLGYLYCSFISHQSKQRIWVEKICGVCASVSLQINHISLCILPWFGEQRAEFGGTVQNRNKRVEAAYSWRSKEKNVWDHSQSMKSCSYSSKGVWCLLQFWKLLPSQEMKGGLVFAGFGWGLLVPGLVCEFRARIEEWSLKDDWGGKEKITR